MTSLAYIIISIAIFFKYIFDRLRSYKKATKQLNSSVLLLHWILLCFTTFMETSRGILLLTWNNALFVLKSQTKLQPVFEKWCLHDFKGRLAWYYTPRRSLWHIGWKVVSKGCKLVCIIYTRHTHIRWTKSSCSIKY